MAKQDGKSADKVAVSKGAKDYKYGVNTPFSTLAAGFIDAPEYDARGKNTKYRPTKYASDGNQIINYLRNWGTDRNRDIYNLLGDVSNLFSNKKSVKGGGFGDLMFGSNPSDWWSKQTPDQGVPVVPDREDNNQAPQGPEEQDAYDTMMAFLSGQGAKNDARLEAMYRQAADYIANQQGATKGIYDTAAQGYNTAQQQASNAVNMGVDVARQQQNRAMKALGIEEAATNILARGEDLSGTQVAAQNRFADYLNANLNRNTGAQTSALQGLLNLSQATIGEGARARASYGERVQGQLMDMLVQQQNAKQSAAAAALEAQAKAEELALKYPVKTPTTVDDVAGATATLLQQAQALNIPADQQQKWVEMQLKQIG